jgi:predicted transcriptional regulator
MARTPQDVTEMELSILQRLWDHGPSTIRQLTEALYPSVNPSCYATVQKLLDRLERKRYVRRHRGDAAHTFTATVGRDDFIGQRLQQMAEQMCGGSLTPLLTHLVRARRLNARERRELRDLIDELDRDPPAKKRQR